MPSKANDLAKRVYEEVTGFSWDETVKPAELPPAKNGVELMGDTMTAEVAMRLAEDIVDASRFEMAPKTAMPGGY